MIPGMAAADVKIFGVIQAETGNVDVDVQGPGGDTDTTAMGNAGNGAIHGGGINQIGFKGTEKLGNGLTAYFKYNNQFSTFDRNSTGAQGWNARDVFVGIKGDGWHTQFGTMNSLYKTASHKYDPFHGTGAQARAQMSSSGLQNGYGDNMGEVGFKSGAWSGGIQLTWEDSSNDNNVDGRASDAVDAGSWNGSIRYKANNWEGSFSYMDLDYGSGAGDMDAWKVAAKYKGNGWTVAGQIEGLDSGRNTAATRRPDGTSNGMLGFPGGLPGVTTNGSELDTWLIAATYDISDSTSLIGRYGQGDLDETAAAGNNDVDYDGWAIGVKHNMSKRTSVYGGYMDNDYDIKAANDLDVDAWIAGLVHKF
jgi:predicted porin